MAADAALLAGGCLWEQKMFAEALAAYAKLKPLANREAQATALLHAGQAAAKKRLAELNAGRAGALPKASKRSDH